MMKQIRKFMIFAICLVMALFAAACGDKTGTPNDGNKPSEPTDTSVVTEYGEIDFAEDMQTEIVNWYGRYYYAKSIKSVAVNNTAAGFEVKFTGTELSAEIRCRDIAAESEFAITGDNYVGISVDGGEYERKQISLGEKQRVVLASGLSEGKHTVKVLKSTEARSTSMEVYTVKTDGKLMTAPARPQYVVEAYGDSITAGHSACKTGPNTTYVSGYTPDGQPIMSDGRRDASSTVAEDGLATYAFFAAEAIGASLQTCCVSGSTAMAFGSGGNVIPNLAKYTDPAASGTRLWDRAAHPVDAVLIDLGTNDIIGGFNAHHADGCTQDKAGCLAEYESLYRADFEADFTAQYKAFVRELRTLYPQAPIIVSYGSFYYGSASWHGPSIASFNGMFAAMAEELDAEVGNVYAVERAQCDYGHPYKAENKAASVAVAEKLKEALGIA